MKLLTRRGLMRAAGICAPAILLRPSMAQFDSCLPGVCGSASGNPPVFVNAGTFLESIGTTITPALPASRVNGNLLVAFVRYSGATTPETFSVSAGWTIFTSVNQGGQRPAVAAYRYVDGAETAPVFTPTDSNVLVGQVLQYSGVVASSPIGATAVNSGTVGPTISCAAFVSTKPGSLAVTIDWNSDSVATATPSGWTLETTSNDAGGSVTVAGKNLIPAGSSSGAISQATTGSNWSVLDFEIKSQ